MRLCMCCVCVCVWLFICCVKFLIYLLQVMSKFYSLISRFRQNTYALTGSANKRAVAQRYIVSVKAFQNQINTAAQKFYSQNQRRFIQTRRTNVYSVCLRNRQQICGQNYFRNFRIFDYCNYSPQVVCLKSCYEVWLPMQKSRVRFPAES